MLIKSTISLLVGLFLFVILGGNAHARIDDLGIVNPGGNKVVINHDVANPNEFNYLPEDVSIGAPHVTVAYGEHPLQAMDVYYGNTNKTLVWFHGGGWEEGDKSLDVMSSYNRVPRALHVAGWTVISVNYRLSPDVHLEEIIADYYSSLVVVGQIVDPNYIVVGGFSAGGHITGVGATAFNNGTFNPPAGVPRVRAILSQDGNMMSTLFTDGLPGISRMLGCLPCTPERIAQSDIATYSDPSDPPVYLIGATESLISIDIQYQTRDAIRASGQVVVFDAVDTGSQSLRQHDVQGMNWSALQVFLSTPSNGNLSQAIRLAYSN